MVDFDRFASSFDASCLFSGGPSADSQEISKFTTQTLVSASGWGIVANSRSAPPLSLTLRVFGAVLATGHLPGRFVTIRLSVPLPYLGEIVQMGHVPGLLLS